MEGLFKELSLQSVYLLGRFRPVRKIIKPWRGIGAIFMYHRILPDEHISSQDGLDDPSVVSVSRFEEQMKYLAENHRVLAMDDLPCHLENPRGFAVAVTFDDGYKDNKVHALPILEKYRIPAVIYIATRFPDNGKGMWWLELDDLLSGVDQIRFTRGKHDMVLDVGTKEQRRKAKQRLAPMFLEAGLREQEEMLDALRRGRPAGVYSDIFMSWNEIKEIAENPLITIGSHTHSHLDAARLSEEQFRQEIETSKSMLEKQLGINIKHFAFPYGSPKRPTEREFRLLQPFATAATTRSMLLAANNNPRDLPRMQITQHDDVTRLNIRLSGIEDMVRSLYYALRKVR